MASYNILHENGKLKDIANKLWGHLHACDLCLRKCSVDRISGKKGFCGADAKLKIAGYMLHTGEEPPISAKNGSGTIFFSNCPLKCVYCQNHSFSQEGEGNIYSIEELSDMMIELQRKGAHNINLVTPEHYLPHIIKAIDMAAEKGLTIPIVYNSSGYALKEILKLIEGVIDIYLPDMKYSSGGWARILSSAPDYPLINKEAVLEMFRQVPDYRFDPETGAMVRGVIIRHLVLPEDASGSFEILSWIKENIGKDVFISLMSQYMPVFKAKNFSQINRRITKYEYNKVQNWAITLGIEKGWWQEDYGLDEMLGEKIKKDFSI